MSQALRNKLQQVSRAAGVANAELEPVLARVPPRQPLSRAAAIRQGRGRWYSTHSYINASLRQYTSTARQQAPKVDRASFPKSRTASAVNRLTHRAPFASTLRPNLTGGTLSRTSGGYSLGGGRVGGARYFSHTPAAPAQVLNNVSVATRAFFLSGQKVQFDGCTSRGENRFRSVSGTQASVIDNIKSVSKFSPGSYIDFHLSPTITALSPLGINFPYGSPEICQASLNTSGFLDVLSVDFSRSLKDLAAIMNDLKKLATLGDLTVELATPSLVRVRFPGCDADTVENLCREVCVTRGVVREDNDFDASAGAQVALMFPFASSSGPSKSMSPIESEQSTSDIDQYSFDVETVDDSQCLPYSSSLRSLEQSESGSAYFSGAGRPQDSSTNYEGLEGIYRFINQCDAARGLAI